MVGQAQLTRTETAHDRHSPAYTKHTVPAVSVIVPTKDEVGNVAPLVELLEQVMPDTPMEIVFVDDSEDGTADEVRRVAKTSFLQVNVLHRTAEERSGGLGGAVVAGFARARAPWVCVMDGDLQHPPSVIADMFAEASRGASDIVVASRFCEDGEVGEFGPLRRLLSKVSTQAAEKLFPSALSRVSDPMSGFFMVRREMLDLDALKPEGFKILLEVLVKTPDLRATEVPFEFGVRQAGESKASALEAARYLKQLWRLRFQDLTERFGRFGLVGASGLAVNTLLLAMLTDIGGMYYLAAAILATQGSTLWNFALTDRWVYKGTGSRFGLGRRMAMFFGMNNAALLVRVPLLYLLVTGIGVNHLAANIVTLLALSVARFGVADSWIWANGKEADTTMKKTTYHYDIHGLVTVSSEGRLPELARFRTETPLVDPTIRVRIGKVSTDGPDESPGRIRYVEKLGRQGFAAEIKIGERVEITASKMLRHSPHVLYTNVVEPVLRWTFAERGYALVHAACMAMGDHAFLITAKTDTGKTTTALKALDALPYSFLSDDLTLLCPDGRVLTYPKPLTISRHTLSAVKTPLLTRKERLGLIIQSRLHSKSGRLFGLIIAKTGMPAATMNAIVQAIVPPPKFQVDRLVPHVEIAPSAQVAGLAIITRDGEEGHTVLEPKEALDILLSNCEDAYGFPPYPIIEHFLHSREGKDLKQVERDIIAKALHGAPAQLLRSYDRNWFEMLPGLVDGAIERRSNGNGNGAAHARAPHKLELDRAAAVA